jgi:hypothetical protein
MYPPLFTSIGDSSSADDRRDRARNPFDLSFVLVGPALRSLPFSIAVIPMKILTKISWMLQAFKSPSLADTRLSRRPKMLRSAPRIGARSSHEFELNQVRARFATQIRAI